MSSQTVLPASHRSSQSQVNSIGSVIPSSVYSLQSKPRNQGELGETASPSQYFLPARSTSQKRSSYAQALTNDSEINTQTKETVYTINEIEKICEDKISQAIENLTSRLGALIAELLVTQSSDRTNREDLEIENLLESHLGKDVSDQVMTKINRKKEAKSKSSAVLRENSMESISGEESSTDGSESKTTTRANKKKRRSKRGGKSKQ